MERRQFIIGSGAILTTAFVSRAKWFLNHEQAVVPLLEAHPNQQTLYFVNTGIDYELRLDDPEMVFPEMTIREALKRYFGVSFKSEKLRLSDYRDLYFEHGVRPTELDEVAGWDWVLDGWARTDSPNARAYQRLEGLELFDCDARGRCLGGLRFIDGCHPGNDYLGVRADDALSASLLQARLCELGKNIRVELLERGV